MVFMLAVSVTDHTVSSPRWHQLNTWQSLAMDGNGTTIQAAGEPSQIYLNVRNALYYAMALSIMFGNCLTLVAVKLTRKLRGIPTNVFIASLAASDGAIGFMILVTVTVKFGSSTSHWTVKACALLGPY